MTIVEKILAAHSGRNSVHPGEIVNAEIDVIMMLSQIIVRMAMSLIMMALIYVVGEIMIMKILGLLMAMLFVNIVLLKHQNGVMMFLDLDLLKDLKF